VRIFKTKVLAYPHNKAYPWNYSPHK